MKHRTTVRILPMLLLLLLSACGGKAVPDNAALTRVIFDRGNASVWGIQFYMDVTPDQISILRFFPESTPGQYVTLAELPISAAQWSEIETVVRKLAPALTVKKQLPRRIRRNKSSGRQYHILTLQWQWGDRVKDVTYDWPNLPEAEALEQLLESIANETDADQWAFTN